MAPVESLGDELLPGTASGTDDQEVQENGCESLLNTVSPSGAPGRVRVTTNESGCSGLQVPETAGHRVQPAGNDDAPAAALVTCNPPGHYLTSFQLLPIPAAESMEVRRQ